MYDEWDRMGQWPVVTCLKLWLSSGSLTLFTDTVSTAQVI